MPTDEDLVEILEAGARAAHKWAYTTTTEQLSMTLQAMADKTREISDRHDEPVQLKLFDEG